VALVHLSLSEFRVAAMLILFKIVIDNVGTMASSGVMLISVFMKILMLVRSYYGGEKL
jgi:uncharacterized membrane protein